MLGSGKVEEEVVMEKSWYGEWVGMGLGGVVQQCEVVVFDFDECGFGCVVVGVGLCEWYVDVGDDVCGLW